MTVLQLCHTKFLHIFVIGFTFTVSPSHPYLDCTWTNFKPVLVLVLVLEHLFSSVLVLVLVLDKNKSPVLVLVLVLELLYLNPCLAADIKRCIRLRADIFWQTLTFLEQLEGTRVRSALSNQSCFNEAENDDVSQWGLMRQCSLVMRI